MNDGIGIEDSMISMAVRFSKKAFPFVIVLKLLGFYYGLHEVGYLEKSSCGDSEIFY